MARKCVICGSSISDEDAFFCLKCYATHSYVDMFLAAISHFIRTNVWVLALSGFVLVFMGLWLGLDWVSMLGLLIFGLAVFAR